MTLSQLNESLEQARRVMHDYGAQFGLDDPRTIAISEQVDRLHMIIQRRMMA